MVTRTGPVARATASAIKAAQLGDQDAAAVALAKHYAGLVDDGDQAAGLRLLKVLDSLGLTPAGRRTPPRGEVTADAPTDPLSSPLSALRDQWGASARQRRTQALHAVPD